MVGQRRATARWWNVVALAIAIVLVAGSCGGSDAADPFADDSDEDFFGSAGGDDNDTSTGSSGGGDFMTIFGVPPFGNASLQEGFGAYELIESDVQRAENVFFVIEGADRDEVLGYYSDTLGAAGYLTEPIVELGDSGLLPLSMAGNSAISGAVQVGPLSPTDSRLGVNQTRTEIVGDPSGGSTDADPPASISSDAGADTLDGDDG